MKITKEFANKVYDILVEYGAFESEREEFVPYIMDFDSEWRFCGIFGFGGKIRFDKYRKDPFFVTCYYESMTVDRKVKLEEVNDKLAKLYRSSGEQITS